MKKIILVFLISQLAFTSKAYCQNLLVEDFNFSGNLNANGWTAHSGSGTNPPNTTSGLSFSGYPNSGIGNAALLDANGEDVNKSFTSQNSGTIYCAFMIRVDDAPTTVDYPIHFNSSSFSDRVFIKKNATPDFEVGFSKSAGSPAQSTTSNFALGTTLLIVIKHTFVAGASNDQSSLFIFTTAAPSTEPGSPDLSDNSGTDPASISAIALRQYSASQNYVVDGIRVATTWSSALPITLKSFSAKPLVSSTLLSFSTATETNNSHFVIERSADARTFSEIGQVRGAGTTQEQHDYTFTDDKPLSGRNYYRLRQVDFDGTESFSPVVSVVFGKSDRMTFAPSPATDRVRIQLDEALRTDGAWQVYDNTGRQVLSGTWEAESADLNLEVNTLPEGMYTFRLTEGAAVQVKQFRKL